MFISFTKDDLYVPRKIKETGGTIWDTLPHFDKPGGLV